MNKYIINDRSTSDKWAIQISNGELKYSTTSELAQSEPIILDSDLSNTYWKLFIDNGQIAVEEIATVQNNSIILTDTETSIIYILVVSYGQLGYNELEQKEISDSGTGISLLEILVNLSLSDTATSEEIISIINSFSLTETITSSETLNVFEISFNDVSLNNRDINISLLSRDITVSLNNRDIEVGVEA